MRDSWQRFTSEIYHGECLVVRRLECLRRVMRRLVGNQLERKQTNVAVFQVPRDRTLLKRVSLGKGSTSQSNTGSEG